MRYIMRGCMVIVLLLSAGCDIPKLTTVLATAGQQNITRQDVVYRIGIAKSYGHKEPMNGTALVYMINDALTRQVAAKIGIEVSQQEVKDLADWLDKHSKTPKILNAVKWVFSDNADDYRRVYVTPRALNRKLQTWYDEHVFKQQRSQQEVETEIDQSTAGLGKMHFDIWFRQQAQSLTVHIRDKKLLADVQKTFPDAWWLTAH